MQETVLNVQVWERFQAAARGRRCNPEQLLNEYMRECLEVWDDQKLDEEIRRDVRVGDYTEEDVVDIGRRLRLEKRETHAGS